MPLTVGSVIIPESDLRSTNVLGGALALSMAKRRLPAVCVPVAKLSKKTMG